jgi:hypothetical protein
MRVGVHQAGQDCTAAGVETSFIRIGLQQVRREPNGQDGFLPNQDGSIFEHAQAAKGVPALRTAG